MMCPTPNSCAVSTHLLSLFTAFREVNACSAEACISSDKEYGCKMTPDASNSSTFCWVDFSSWLSDSGSEAVWNYKWRVLKDVTQGKMGNICGAVVNWEKGTKCQEVQLHPFSGLKKGGSFKMEKTGLSKMPVMSSHTT
jgi:hypothetical protein